MPRASYFIVFLLAAFGVLLLLHYYLYRQLSSHFLSSNQAKSVITFVLCIGALLFVFAEAVSRGAGAHPLLQLAGDIGGIWLGVFSVAVFVFFLRNILLFIVNDAVVSRYSWIAAASVIIVVSAYSLFNEARLPRVSEATVRLRGLPLSLSGFTIVQLSDLHINSLKSRKRLEYVIKRANAINPDLVVITGDVIDSGQTDCAELLKELKAKKGVYAVTGNHEYYAGLEAFLSLMRRSGIQVLSDENKDIADGLTLIGINDEAGKQFTGKEADLGKAFSGVRKDRINILLSHRPDIFDKARKQYKIDLQLSGHTHAGQIPPMDLIVYFYFKYPYGCYEKGGSYLYTSCGTGIWGTPMRFLNRSEIVKITALPE